MSSSARKRRKQNNGAASKTDIQVGDVLFCISRTNERVKCKVMQIMTDATTGDPKYYIHYGVDRRMDEWVQRPRLVAAQRQITSYEFKEIDDHCMDYAKVRNIHAVFLGGHRMDAWYFSALPLDYWMLDIQTASRVQPAKNPKGEIHFCDYCLRFFVEAVELECHRERCQLHHPPGNEIYRDAEKKINMFEIDGAHEKEYTENLCYLAKMFLREKSTQYDPTIFLFYVLCEIDEYGCNIVGYFSKEKCSANENNLACILVLPAHQRKGYGSFLIQFSYALSKLESKKGTPEQPFSDLGKVTYHRYWLEEIVKVLTDPKNHLKNAEFVTIDELSDETNILPDDIVAVLNDSGLVSQVGSEKHLRLSDPKIDEVLKRLRLRLDGRVGPQVDPLRINWRPYIPTPEEIAITKAEIERMNREAE